MVRARRQQCGYLILAVVVVLAGVRPESAAQPNPSVSGVVGTLTTRPAGPSVTGITAPRQVVKLASVDLERISRIAVVEGQMVKEGELVIAFDDAVQRARTETARAAAGSTLEVELAQQRMEKTRLEHERLARLATTQAVSAKELNDAALDAAMARLEHEIMKFRQTQAGREYEREQLILDRLSVRAPFTGYVTEILKREGESVKEGEPIVTLVQLDPVEVMVDCPLGLAVRVREGDRAEVRPVDPQWPPRLGTVVFANRAADPASQTFKVKLVVPNDDSGWITGLKVVVDFPLGRAVTRSEGSRPGVPEPGRAARR